MKCDLWNPVGGTDFKRHLKGLTLLPKHSTAVCNTHWQFTTLESYDNPGVNSRNSAVMLPSCRIMSDYIAATVETGLTFFPQISYPLWMNSFLMLSLCLCNAHILSCLPNERDGSVSHFLGCVHVETAWTCLYWWCFFRFIPTTL